MATLILLCCLVMVSQVAVSQMATRKKVVFGHVPSVFGDLEDPATQEYYREGCLECTLSEIQGFFSHKNACNMIVRCINFGSFFMLYGEVLPPNNLFNENQLHLADMFFGKDQIPNRAACPKVGHPCDTGKMIPMSGDACKGYRVCVNNQMVERNCPDRRFGFNAMTQQCDRPCSRFNRTRTLLSEYCRPNPKSQEYYFNYQTVRYSDKPNDIIEETFNLRCTLGYKYLDPALCRCVPVNETKSGCETVNVVHLDSEDNSWLLARHQTPLMGASVITGNATFLQDSNTNNKLAPFFSGNKVLVAPGVHGNDFGLYFDFNMTFRSMRTDTTTPGLSFSGSFGTQDFALADNSACDISATYGCSLQARGENSGRVVCYVRPKGEQDNPENIVATSDILDLTQEIDVYFAKDDAFGLLSVKVGGRELVTRFTFPKGVRAIGNVCPLSIGAGVRKGFFNGYMQRLIIRKYCGPFL